MARAFDWTFSEAGAAWIALCVTWVAIIWRAARRRLRTRVLITRQHKATLASIQPEIENRLTILFDNEPVRRLHETIFSVRNLTRAPINGLEVRIAFRGARRILAARAITLPHEEGTSKEVLIRGDGIDVKVAQLNPFDLHEHELRVAVLVDGAIEEWTALGRGDNWSVKHTNVEKQFQPEFLLPVPVAVAIGYAAHILSASFDTSVLVGMTAMFVTLGFLNRHDARRKLTRRVGSLVEN